MRKVFLVLFAIGVLATWLSAQSALDDYGRRPVKGEWPNSKGGTCPLCSYTCSLTEYEGGEDTEIECNDCSFNCLAEDAALEDK